jgi:predicted metal-binding membrane protein
LHVFLIADMIRNMKVAYRSAVPLAATLGLAALAWIVTARQMHGMDMGVATQLGSFAFFVALWAAMMAAMMLPGLVPAVLSRSRRAGPVRAVVPFVASYLAVWTLVGAVLYALYRPHGTITAGLVVIAAGFYELTRLKQHCRRCCRARTRSGNGFEFGLYCVGSSLGLMVMLAALGIMSVPWMLVVAVLVVGQKLLPAKPAIDVPLAVALVTFGFLILAAPGSVPGLMPPM